MAKTAAYHRFAESPVDNTSQSHRRRLRTSAIRLKPGPPLSHLPSEPLLKPATAMTPRPNPHHSTSDMFELIKQAAAEKRISSYRTFQRQGIKIGTPVSAERGNARIAAHPLLDKETVLGLPRTMWNHNPLFPAPVQRGSGVVYALGRKNWLREHDQRIRVAQVRRYRS